MPQKQYLPALQSGALLDFLVNCKKLLKLVKLIPEEYLRLSEKRLEQQMLLADGGEVDKRLHYVKISFWDEYNYAVDSGEREMREAYIYIGACSDHFFYEKIAKNPLRLAWLITPPVQESLIRRNLIKLGYDQLYDTLTTDPVEVIDKTTTDKRGKTTRTQSKKLNMALVKQKFDILKHLENRELGGVVQRQQIEARTLNTHVQRPAAGLDINTMTTGQLDAMHKDVRKQLKSDDEVIDVDTDE